MCIFNFIDICYAFICNVALFCYALNSDVEYQVIKILLALLLILKPAWDYSSFALYNFELAALQYIVHMVSKIKSMQYMVFSYMESLCASIAFGFTQ